MSQVIVNSQRVGDKVFTIAQQSVGVIYQPSEARRAQLAAASIPALKKETAKKAKTRKEAGATGKRKPKLRDNPRRAGADDLKKISGIGSVLEQTLNEQGVFHFDQIAGWDEANLAWIDEHWGCGNKVRRDNWISQAKELASA